jgi:hypothetical protein
MGNALPIVKVGFDALFPLLAVSSGKKKKRDY